jgi:hypothetical protein
VSAERVHGDLLADQVARSVDRTVFLDEVALPRVVVRSVVADDRLDRRPRRDQLDDGAVEGAAKIDVAGGRRLDVLRAADGVAHPLEPKRRQVAKILGKLREEHLAGPALVPQLGLFQRRSECRSGQAQRDRCGQQETMHDRNQPGVS